MPFPENISSFPESGGSGRWGWFALVAYIPDPQKSLLDSLRTSIPGELLPPVHITLLPPRPLPFSIEHACSRAEGITSGTPAFEAELSEVRSFSETDFLYLDIAKGRDSIYEIHGKLNAGDLHYSELHEFRPHLTLGGPVPQSRLHAAREAVANEWHKLPCSRSVLVDEVVCLWLDPAKDGREWIKHRSFSLQSPARAPIAMAAEATTQRSSIGAPSPDPFGHQGS